MNFYPHHIGDFDKATRHMTRIERSVYRDLIEQYYDTEQRLTIDRAVLCRKIIARTDEEVTAVEQALNEFFTETATGWYHERCEIEIERYKSNNNQQSMAGKASALKRAAIKQQAIHAGSTPDSTPDSTPVERALNQLELEPLTINQDKNKTFAQTSFTRFWFAYPKKKSKGDAERAWAKLNPDEQLVATIIAKIEQAKTSENWKKQNGQYAPYPASWLNSKGWEDENDESDFPNGFEGAI